MMRPDILIALVVVGFFGLLGGLMLAQHTETMACTQAGIKASECAVLK